MNRNSNYLEMLVLMTEKGKQNINFELIDFHVGFNNYPFLQL